MSAVRGEVRVDVLVDGRTLTTTAGPGEPWFAAARRLAPGADDPVATDLSGGVARFAVDPAVRVAVRPMTRGDLADVVAWRAAEHVRRWWDALDGIEAAEATYGPRLDGRESVAMWVFDVNGRSVGLAQDYRIGDHPEYAVLAPDPDAVGVDYLVGRPEWVGRGVGTRCLWAWVRHLHERDPSVTTCFAAPDHRNRASLRALAKVGFVEGLWFDQPRDDGPVDTVVGCTLDVRRVLG